MKKEERVPYRFESLSEVHQVLGLPKPLHPLITLVEVNGTTVNANSLPGTFIYNFYKISYKKNLTGKLRYGQSSYDFDEGGLFFKGPNQVAGVDGANNGDHSGYTLLIHPDFLLNYPLAQKIKQYGFFSYAVHEALHLSEKERDTVVSIFKHLDDELQARIDDFSHDVVISLIETLLNYSNRFYKRQFLTRKAASHELLQKLEEILEDYFANGKSVTQGIITVQFLADALNLSPGYLSDMLRSLTGQSAQQHIHDKLIEKAKEKISATGLSIGEISYQLGFEHPSSFNKLFKARTSLSPLEFRTSFHEPKRLNVRKR